MACPASTFNSVCESHTNKSDSLCRCSSPLPAQTIAWVIFLVVTYFPFSGLLYLIAPQTLLLGLCFQTPHHHSYLTRLSLIPFSVDTLPSLSSLFLSAGQTQAAPQDHSTPCLKSTSAEQIQYCSRLITFFALPTCASTLIQPCDLLMDMTDHKTQESIWEAQLLLLCLSHHSENTLKLPGGILEQMRASGCQDTSGDQPESQPLITTDIRVHCVPVRLNAT